MSFRLKLVLGMSAGWESRKKFMKWNNYFFHRLGRSILNVNTGAFSSGL